MVSKKRRQLGITWPLAILDPTQYTNELEQFIVSTPEIDYPGVIPDKYVCVGPILQAVEPVAQKDPQLDEWLSRNPTILISLGSHFEMEPEYAQALSEALALILNVRHDVQILWKYKPSSPDAQVTTRAIQQLVIEDKVKIVNWLEADPLAILQTGHVCCVVNHGGSNSYHEAVA